MNRPSRLEILEYALTGVMMCIGTSVPVTDDDFEWLDQMEADRDWIESEIARVKFEQGKGLPSIGDHVAEILARKAERRGQSGASDE